MYKLLIVDDDPWVREWLVKHMNWKEYGFSEICEAVNGCDALKIIEEKRPNIVITDIKMDGMSGLELLANVREKYPDIRVVLLSGYNEFEYARFAIKKGAIDYLLKPVEEKELITLSIRILKEIEQEYATRAREHKIAEQLERSIPILQEKFIKELLSGNIAESDYLKNELSNRSIHLDFSVFYILVLEIDNCSSFRKAPHNEEWNLMKKELRCTVEHFLNEKGTSISFFENHRLVAGLNPNPNDSTQDLYMISREVRAKTGYTVSIGVSRLKKDITLAREAYIEALEALKRKFYLGMSRVIFASGVEPLSKESFIDIKMKEQLLNAVSVGDRDRVTALIDEIFSEICEKMVSFDLLQLVLIRIMGILNDSLTRTGVNHEVALVNDLDVSARLEEIETVDGLKEWVTGIFLKGIETAYGNGTRRSRKIIEDSIEYVYKHICEDISLDAVAKVLYVNPAYLSRLFKSEVGETFTHFLMKTRIEKAKKLLKESYLKVYEISEQVGYKNEKYFSRIFKDFEGITPNEYRDS